MLRRVSVTVLAYGLTAAACFLAVRAYTPIRVSGSSMHPALHAGDLVFVTRGTPQRGDIALLRMPGHGPVLHRIVGVEADGTVRTRGDANPVDDLEPVNREHVAGTVAAVLPVGAAIERWRGR